MGERKTEEKGRREGGTAGLPTLITVQLHLGPPLGDFKSFGNCCFLAQTAFSF